MKYDVCYYYEDGHSDLLLRRSYPNDAQALSDEFERIKKNNTRRTEGRKCNGITIYRYVPRTGSWKTIYDKRGLSL